MSVWNDLLKWALNAAKTEAQQDGLKALQDASTGLTKVVQQHAPDLASTIQPLINQAVQSAVAGILSKVGH